MDLEGVLYLVTLRNQCATKKRQARTKRNESTAPKPATHLGFPETRDGPRRKIQRPRSPSMVWRSGLAFARRGWGSEQIHRLAWRDRRVLGMNLGIQ